MSNASKIDWLRWPRRQPATLNPWIGCTPVSEGCDNCYARREEDGRFRHLGRCVGLDPIRYDLPAKGQPYFNRGPVYQGDEVLRRPLAWKAPRTVFVCSRSDLFHQDLTFEQIGDVFAIMAATRRDIYILCTKRAARMAEWFHDFGQGLGKAWGDDGLAQWVKSRAFHFAGRACLKWPLPNVVLMVTAENQARADERIPELLRCPAVCRGVSIEPMLGAVDLGRSVGRVHHASYHDEHGPCTCERDKRLDWVIVGGESGKDGRPMHPNWARGVRDQCAAAGVPLFFKQWGQWAPPDQVSEDTFIAWDAAENAAGNPALSKPWPFGKKAAGHLLDGIEHRQLPALAEARP